MSPTYLKSKLSYFIKRIIRFIIYPNERAKVFREISVRRKQNFLIGETYSKDCNHLIVFIVDGVNYKSGIDEISGGILSITSIYQETERLLSGTEWRVIMVTHQDGHLFLKHTQFKNNIPIFRFEQLTTYFTNLKKILFHLPEYLAPLFATQLESCNSFQQFETVVSINILNQNILLMPSLEVIERLKSRCSFITQTTAHAKYSTPEVEQKFGLKLFKLSVFASIEKYQNIPFGQKENIIAVSPDNHPLKQSILEELKASLPEFSIKVIEKLKYEDYLTLIGKAKFMITLGEGLDFYFIETIFSGGVSVAVYNEDFFPAHFKNCQGLYISINTLTNGIVEYLKAANNEENYRNIQLNQLRYVESEYKYHEYLENLTTFYNSTLN